MWRPQTQAKHSNNNQTNRDIIAGYQGEVGCYSQEAATRYWRREITTVPFKTFEDVLSALMKGEITHAVLPVYNSLIGPIAACHAAMERYLCGSERLDAVAKISIPVRHALLCKQDSGQNIGRVISHPAALKQCERFLSSLPETVSCVEYYDTAGAAMYISSSQASNNDVAIASERCAEIYNLRILQKNIQDREDNYTQFAIIERQDLIEQSIVGIRGAITVDQDTDEAIAQATNDLLSAIVSANDLNKKDIISAVFTATGDLRAAFPAKHAREIGWNSVPMLCTTEMAVDGALPMCIRVLLHIAKPSHNKVVQHVYLRGARVLRPDLNFIPECYMLSSADFKSSIISL